MHLKLPSVFIALIICTVVKAEFLDDIYEQERFCYPDNLKNSRKSCLCNRASSDSWDIKTLDIDCSYKNLASNELTDVLPLLAESLDLSWNSLTAVPVFVSDSLTVLNVQHNNISSVATRNFAHIGNLQELYLSWNSIQFIAEKAFDDLTHLQVLDLSHNNLQTLNLQVFSHLLALQTLSLSWNRHLNETKYIQTVDFYASFGINSQLQMLQLESCNLMNISLPKNATLQTLDLRGNLLTQIPANLPAQLQSLDLSDNLLVSLSIEQTQNLSNIKQLYLEDMPRLGAVQQSALKPLQSLQKISFMNSRQLSHFDGYVFGVNATEFPPLNSVIFRGTTMRGLNSTLAAAFAKLSELDLNGMPLHCNCELIWIHQLPIETHGRCYKPSRLRGTLLARADVKEFSCDRWPRWVYGLIILILIFICSAGIYLIVMGLRPNRDKVQMRRKVGPGSPYSRVTIEPNRQEQY